MTAATGSSSSPGEARTEPRPLPPAMAVIGSILFGLFMALVMATIIAVVTDDTPEAALLDQLPLVDGVSIVESMSTCTDSACDGVGVVLTGSNGEGVAGRLASSWRSRGWGSLPCVDDGAMCFSSEDLRLSMSVWADVDPLSIPALVESVADQGVDTSRLVYVHFYRCGLIHPCD